MLRDGTRRCGSVFREAAWAMCWSPTSVCLGLVPGLSRSAPFSRDAAGAPPLNQDIAALADRSSSSPPPAPPPCPEGRVAMRRFPSTSSPAFSAPARPAWLRPCSRPLRPTAGDHRQRVRDLASPRLAAGAARKLRQDDNRRLHGCLCCTFADEFSAAPVAADRSSEPPRPHRHRNLRPRSSEAARACLRTGPRSAPARPSMRRPGLERAAPLLRPVRQ